MSREIKFRAWTKMRPRTEKRMHHFDFYDADMYAMCEEVMQFTGLKDKNGKDIYEGDIVTILDDPEYSAKSYGCGVVKYGKFESSHEAGYSRGHVHVGFYIADSTDAQMWGWCNEDPEWEYVEIIGNIYENPELIK